MLDRINVMIDLETMSTRSNAAVCSIGAVKFQDQILDTFYVTIDLKDCVNRGLHVSKDTITWWSKQNKEALKELTRNNVSLIQALASFTEWYGPKSLPTWGNGAAFDNVVMENAYMTIGEQRPWKYWDDRCYRTMNALIKIKEDERQGVYHNALDDAMHQTKHLIKILGS